MAVRAPLLRHDLARLLDSESHVRWSFSATLACRVLGRDRAVRVWRALIGGKWGRGKLATWVALVTVWVVLTVLEVFKLGGGFATSVSPMFILFSVGVFFVIVISGCYFLDLRIVSIIVRGGFFISNMLLAVVALVTTSDVWGNDVRALITGMLLAIVAFISLVDAFPPELRRVVGIPIFLILEVSFFSVLVLLAFGRFPESQERIVELGDVGGMAARNLTMSVRQLAADATSAFVVLCTRMLWHVYSYSSNGFLIRIQAPVRCIEAPDAVMDVMQYLEWFRPKPRPTKPGPLPSSSSLGITIPVLEKSVQQLMDPSGRVLWSARNTFLAKAIGFERAQAVVKAVHQGPPKVQVVKIVMFGSVFVAFLVIVGLTLSHSMPPLPAGKQYVPLVVATAAMGLVDLYIFVAFYDAHIFSHVLKTFDFYLQLALTVIGATGMCLFFDGDEKSVLVIPFVFLILFAAASDATVPLIRETVGPLSLVVLLMLYLLLIVLIQLGRFPDQYQLVYDFGTFGGLSARPLTVDVQQTLTNVLVGQLWMFLYLFINWWQQRHDPVLITVGLRLVGGGDPTFVHFPSLRGIRMFGLGTAYEESRRVSVMDSSQHLAAANPRFATTTTTTSGSARTARGSAGGEGGVEF